ncbi:hypothetical protein NDU88_001958 [Pleurodeles waltl]|uniref:Uncharacterized protein n=1 Tax=Pleurodeles waltl TaxID=8319 RepID=A0AAV7LHI2_PLEWA|nr:hypothetical protein NDU88_001958 [Pleurodeles waltl]
MRRSLVGSGVEAKSEAGLEQEEEESSRPHYPQDEDTRTGTENKDVPEIWSEDWWMLPVEAPEPTTILASCG